MNTQEFTNLYTKQERDESLNSFTEETGFSLVRKYPDNTPYEKDGLRMFIKIALLNGKLFYEVNITKPEEKESKTSYIILDSGKYKNKLTSFISDRDSDEFTFDTEKQKVIHIKKNKEFSLNEFVNIIENNHLSDRLFWKRKINFVANLLLKIFFWLSDKHYEKVKVSIDKYHFSKNNEPTTEEEKNIEPFFKYFYISKNLIFFTLLLSLFIALASAIFPNVLPLKCIWTNLFGDFSLSNPLVVLLFFLVLFSIEKISIWLNNKIKNFLTPEQGYFSRPKENFIDKLHNYQYKNKFNLKI